MKKLINYLKGVKIELTHVNWPTKKQIINFTGIVIAISLFVAFLLGFFDFILSYLLEKFIL